MIMKKFLSMLTLAVGVATFSFAQTNEGNERTRGRKIDGREWKEAKAPEDLAKIRTERLVEELQLTDAQKNEIYALTLEHAKRLSDGMSEIKNGHQAIREDAKTTDAAIRNVLTDTQQEQLDAKREEVKSKRSEAPRGPKRSGERGGRQHVKPVGA